MSTDTLSLASTIRRNENSLATEVDGSLVLMSIDKGNYYSLDAIGADIWQRIEAPLAVAELCAALFEAYDAEAETIQHDVLALLAHLVEEGLVETSA